VVIRKKPDEKSARREAMAKKIGFEAYGAGKDMPDPIQNALDSILDHMHKMDEELEALRRERQESEEKD